MNKDFGWFSPGQMRAYDMIAAEVSQGDKILEVGCLLGKATKYLAEKINESGAELHCVDPWDSNTASSKPEFCKQFEEAFGEDLYPTFRDNVSDFEFITAHKMTAVDFFSSLPPDTKFKHIYIDGNHKARYVKKDIINSLRHVRDDGFIWGDDYIPANLHEVSPVVDEIFGDSVEIFDRHWKFDVSKNKELHRKLLEMYNHVDTTKEQKSITGLMPLKIMDETNFGWFKECISSFLPVIKKHEVLIRVCNESPSNYTARIQSYFNEIGLEVEYVKGNGFVNAVQSLIRSVKEDYFFFMLDDVELLTSKDFITPILGAFDRIPGLAQVKYGAGIVGRKSKRKSLELYSHLYTPHQEARDTIWYKTIADDTEEYILSHYNAVLDSKIFKELDSKIDINNNIPTWDAYVVQLRLRFINEISHYRTGWLNMEDYLFCHGRQNIPGGVPRHQSLAFIEECKYD